MPTWTGHLLSAPKNRWLGVGYAGLLGFFALEGLFRRPGGASSLKASEDDHGTTRLMIAAYAIATGLPLTTRRLSAGRLPPAHEVAPVPRAKPNSGEGAAGQPRANH